MSYEMVEVTDRLRVGRMQNGKLDIELYDRPWKQRDAQMQALVIPPDQAAKLMEYLLKVGAYA